MGSDRGPGVIEKPDDATDNGEALAVAREITAYVDVIDLVELDKITVFELSGHRRDGMFDGIDPVDPDAPDDPINISPSIRVMFREQDEWIAVRARMEHEAKHYLASVDLAVSYRKSEPFRLSDGIKAEFIQNLALINLFPYLRQHFADITSRIGYHRQLGLIRTHQSRLTPAVDELDQTERGAAAASGAPA